MKNTDIITQQRGALGIIMLNRPEALNATSYEMVLAIDAALTTFVNNDSLKHIAIMSRSDRAFCAGGDIRAAYTAMKAGDMDACEAYFRAEYQLMYRLATFPKPVHAFINGLCLGGGMGLSAHCTARIAGENAVFGMPETRIGFFPDVGAAYFYNQCDDPAEGMYLALTGNKFDRDHAIRNGIATHAIDQSQWESVIEQLICGKSLDECVFKSAEVRPNYLPQDVHVAFSHETLSELIAALPSTVLAEMRTKSPLSIAVTHAYIQRARGLSLQAVLEQDFALAMNFVRHGEFKEGIRALLIDKDKTPKWSYAWWNQAEPYDAISEEILLAMFNPPKMQLFS
ncbi:MAG: enoyl-CoA hydratase/isomerase family protein [Pseudomonadota bacterium]